MCLFLVSCTDNVFVLKGLKIGNAKITIIAKDKSITGTINVTVNKLLKTKKHHFMTQPLMYFCILIKNNTHNTIINYMRTNKTSEVYTT